MVRLIASQVTGGSELSKKYSGGQYCEETRKSHNLKKGCGKIQNRSTSALGSTAQSLDFREEACVLQLDV